QIVTYSLPKNLTRFFVRTCGRFACFSGSHGRFYMAKRQGYVASGSQGAFPAILPLHNRPYEDEKEQKICPPALDGYHHAAIGKVFWRDGKVIWRSTRAPDRGGRADPPLAAECVLALAAPCAPRRAAAVSRPGASAAVAHIRHGAPGRRR